jgi:DNA-binding transcriptional LysR family regulator
MTLEQLRVFVAVAEALHVTRAAESLHMTQSAASASIATLESRYDTKLFHRIGRRIELTREGEQFLPQARAVLQRAAAAELALSELAGVLRGELHVAASQTVVNDWLPTRLVDFHAQYPGVRVRVRSCNTEQAERAVLDGSADLAVVEGGVESDFLDIAEVPGDRLVLVVPLGHAWVARADVTADELRDATWVMRESGSGTRQLFEAEMQRRGIDPAALHVAIELPSNESVLAAVQAGAGPAVVSELAARRHALPIVELSLPLRCFSVLQHRERSPGRAQQALMALLVGSECGATGGEKGSE